MFHLLLKQKLPTAKRDSKNGDTLCFVDLHASSKRLDGSHVGQLPSLKDCTSCTSMDSIDRLVATIAGRVRIDMQAWVLGEAVDGPPTWILPTIPICGCHQPRDGWRSMYIRGVHCTQPFCKANGLYRGAGTVPCEWNSPCTTSRLPSPVRILLPRRGPYRRVNFGAQLSNGSRRSPAMPLPPYFSSLVTSFCVNIDRVPLYHVAKAFSQPSTVCVGSLVTRGRRQHAEGSRLARSRNRNPHRKQWRSCKKNARNKSTFD